MHKDLAIAEAQLAGGQAEYDKAAAELEKAQESLARRAPLGNAVSGEEVAGARYAVKLAQAHLGSSKAQVQEKRERIAQLRLALAHAEVRAPFGGSIVARFVDPGALVQPASPLVRLIGDGELWVRFAIPAGRSSGAHAGDPIRVKATDLPEVATMRIERLTAEIDPATRMVVAESRLQVPEAWKGHHLSGRSARVWLAHASSSPSRAVSP